MSSPSSTGFGRNAAWMVIGTGASQGLVLVSLLVFARLYGPAAIGIQALYVSIAGLLVTLASLRLDLALVLERSDGRARWVGFQAVVQAVAVAVVVGIALLIAGSSIGAVLASDTSSHLWLALLPLACVLGVSMQVGLSQANRTGRFVAMVLPDLSSSLGFMAAGLVMWAWGPGDSALAASRQFGQIAAVVVLACAGYLAFGVPARRMRLARFRRTWSEHRQFLKYNTPYSLIGAFSRDLPIFVFAALGSVEFAASYALARSITVAPAVLFSSAVSRVFFKEAVEYFGTPRLSRTIVGLATWGLRIGLVPFAWLTVWGDVALPLLLGEPWRLAGATAALLAPAVWMSQTGWIERIFEVARRQGVPFAMQVGFDLINAVIVIGTFVVTNSYLATVGAFAGSLLCFYTFYLVAALFVAGFSMRDAVHLVAGPGLMFGVAVLACAGMRWLLPNQTMALGLSVALGLVAVVGMGQRLVSEVRLGSGRAR